MKNVCITLATISVMWIWQGTAHAVCSPPGCNKIVDHGPDAQKKVLVIMGDGYASGDQARWTGDVDRLLTSGLFANEFFNENANAFNVYRLDLVSTDSGVSQRSYDDSTSPPTLTSQTLKNTALGYVWTGQWSHCWLEYSANTGTLRNNALSQVPKYDFVMVVLNQDAYGGCNRGPLDIAVPRGVDWHVLAHESGHGIGGLRDEYTATNTPWGGGPVTTCPTNCSTLADRNNVCWNRFINPATPDPTVFGPGMDSNQTVGEFEGCGTVATGIYRPVSNCRMNSNTPPYCPVCYNIMKHTLYPALQQNFDNAFVGDFNGDGRSDVLIHNGNDLAIYTTNPSNYTLSLLWTGNDIIPAAPGGATWQPAANDQYFIGDFDNDGKDDVFVFNGTDWNKPYLGLLHSTGTGLECVARYDGTIPGFWTMSPDDQFYVGDFNGDHKADLYIFNGAHWAYPYLGMLQSNGNSLTGLVSYGSSVPGWTMKPGDKFFPGDFDGDGKTDLYVFNGGDWSYRYFGMLKSSGAALSDLKTFSGTLPGWTLSAGDKFYVGDFDGDGKSDVYVFNGANWSYTYLMMLRSLGNDMAWVNEYNGSTSAASVPGWQIESGDQLFVSDANKDGKADLFIFNPATNWSVNYLGTMISSGTSLSASWSANWIGNWHLGVVDKPIVARYEGGFGKADIFIHNTEWFGLLRYSAGSFTNDRIYYHWINTPLYDSKPWSDTMP